MVLYVKHIDNTRDFYVLQTEKDFAPLFEHYPNAHGIAMMSHGLRHAAENIAKYLSNHHLTAWVEDNDLNKGLKGLAVGLGLSAAAGLGLSRDTSTYRQPAAQVQQVDNFGHQPEDKFLWNIMQLESSGGKNLGHSSANVIGRWGIKKPTINEMIDRAGKNLPQHLGVLRNMDHGQTAAYFKQNPQAETDIARMVARHVLKRQKGDTHKAAYAWLHGHNLQAHDIPSGAMQSSEYVRKFKYMHSKNPLAATSVVKSEDSRSFTQRLSDWVEKRRAQEREMIRDHSFWPDPGRQIDDEQNRKEDKDGVFKLKLKTMAAEGKHRDK